MKKTTINITIEDDKQIKCVLKEPDYKTYCAALNCLNTTDENGNSKLLEAGDIILINCLIQEESDSEVLTRADVRIFAAQAATSLIQVWGVDVKKS
jgi:hypothetical protein